MNPTTTEFDYEEIVKKFVKKGVTTDKLVDKRSSLESKLWSVFHDYFEAKEKCDFAESSSNAMQSIVAKRTKIRTDLDRENAFLNEKLKTLQQLHAEIEGKAQNQMKQFFIAMEGLNQDFRKLCQLFDNKNMREQISDNVKSLELFEQQIAVATKQIEVLNNSVEDSEHVLMLNAKVVVETVQKESLEQYGDSTKIQCRLSEMRKNIEFLSRKVVDIKVKYGIHDK